MPDENNTDVDEGGEYVVYEHLKSLLAELPIPQSKMVQMRIQVGFQVTQIRNATIFRLDPDIGTKHQGLVHRPQIAPKRKREEGDEEEKEEEVLEDVQEVDQEEEQPVEPQTLSMAIPATCRRAWSEEELRMADWNEPDCKKAFHEYIRRCTEASVPCRSYSAFKRAKLKQMRRVDAEA